MIAATDAPATADERFHRRFLWGVTALLAIGLWLWPLRSSLWTDELGTWWVIKDGLGDAIDRALTFHGQSPLFYVLLWGTRHVAGRSRGGAAPALAVRGRRRGGPSRSCSCAGSRTTRPRG